MITSRPNALKAQLELPRLAHALKVRLAAAVLLADGRRVALTQVSAVEGHAVAEAVVDAACGALRRHAGRVALVGRRQHAALLARRRVVVGIGAVPSVCLIARACWLAAWVRAHRRVI